MMQVILPWCFSRRHEYTLPQAPAGGLWVALLWLLPYPTLGATQPGYLGLAGSLPGSSSGLQV